MLRTSAGDPPAVTRASTADEHYDDQPEPGAGVSASILHGAVRGVRRYSCASSLVIVRRASSASSAMQSPVHYAHMHTSTLEHGERHREPDPAAADVAKDSDVEAAAAELRDQGVTECVASVCGGAGAADGRNDDRAHGIGAFGTENENGVLALGRCLLTLKICDAIRAVFISPTAASRGKTDIFKVLC